MNEISEHGIVVKGALQGQLIEQCKEALRRRIRALPTVWLLGRPPGADWGDVVESNDAEIPPGLSRFSVMAT